MKSAEPSTMAIKGWPAGSGSTELAESPRPPTRPRRCHPLNGEARRGCPASLILVT
jgi:hypothetical protein